MRHWLARSLFGAALLSGLLALVALWGSWASQPTEVKIEHFYINVVLVVSLQVFSGNSGILSFGQMALVTSLGLIAATEVTFGRLAICTHGL